MNANIKVGTLMRPSGSEVTYTVVRVGEFGCAVEVADGRKLHYSEKRFTLACDRNTGKMFDDRWRGWEVVR